MGSINHRPEEVAKRILARRLTGEPPALGFPMSIRPCRSEIDLHSLAGTARALLTSTRTVAEVHMTGLKEQLEDLWAAAEELLPRTAPADLISHVEKTLEELRSWNVIGLRSGFAT
jgi:hypothetical protein